MSTATPNSEGFEIIGFDGSTRAPVGLFFPIVRDPENDRFFKLPPNSTNETASHVFYLKREIDSLARDGVITLLPRQAPVFNSAVAVYVSYEAAAGADYELPPAFQWQELTSQGLVGLSDEKTAEEFVKELAEALTNNATDSLISFFATHKRQRCEDALELIKMARPAARDKVLRARVLLRYALALKYSRTPERLDNAFQLRIQREFPTWTWQSFQTRLNRLAEMLHDQAFTLSIDKRSDVESSYMVLAINRSLSYVRSADDQSKVELCLEVADDFRNNYPVSNAQISEVAEMLLTQDHVRLDDPALRVLGGEPVFYNFYGSRELILAPATLENGFSYPEDRPFLRSFDFNDSADEFEKQGGTVGDLANTVREHTHKRSVMVAA